MSLTLNQTVSTKDTDIIWIIQIMGDSTTYKFSDKGITLSGYLYDGAVLFDEDSTFSESNDISNGGSVGSVSSFNFSISRYTDNTGTDGYFNEFYPNNSVYLTNREVRIGFVWAGATTESQITFLPKMIIEEFDVDPTHATVVCYEKKELEMIDLPQYQIQKDYDNGVSYFPDAPDENMGKCIPIVYGDLFQDDGFAYSGRIMPLINVGNSQYLMSSHICYNVISGNVDNRLFEYVSEYATRIGATPYPYQHNQSGLKAVLSGGSIYGAMHIYPKYMIKSNSTILNSINEITRIDKTMTSTYVQIPHNENIGLTFIQSNYTQSDIGVFSDSTPATSAFISFFVEAETSSQNVQIKYQNSAGGYFLTLTNHTVGTSLMQIADGVSIGSGFSFAGMMQGKITIGNNDSSHWIRIYDVFLGISDTVKQGIQTIDIRANTGYYVGYHNLQTGRASGKIITASVYSGSNIITWDGQNAFGTGAGRTFQ